MSSSSETFQPAEGAAADQASHPSVGEMLSAANREAIEEADSVDLESVGFEPDTQAEELDAAVEQDETSDEDVDADGADPEEDAEEQAEDSEEESEETTDANLEWDGDPETAPPELRPAVDRALKLMNKGMNQKFRELAAEREKAQQLSMQYQQALLKIQEQGQAQVQDASKPQRPTPPGEGATAQDWQTYEDAVVDYRLALNGNKGSMSDEAQQRLAVLEEQQALDKRQSVITQQPGCNDEIMGKMNEMFQADDRYKEMYYKSEETAIQFFREAQMAVREEAIAAKEAEIAKRSAETAKATAQRNTGAAGRATSRPGSVRAASGAPETTFNKKAFPSVTQQLAEVNRLALAEHGK